MGRKGRRRQRVRGPVHRRCSRQASHHLRTAPRPVKVRDLAPNRDYLASTFDPVSGERTELGADPPRRNRIVDGESPRGTTADWVLVVRPQKETADSA